MTDKALREIARMGFTHIWLTGVLRHATQTAHPGLPAQPESIVKGLAGSPYAVLDYFDVDPDLGSAPELRMEEFKALVKRTGTAMTTLERGTTTIRFFHRSRDISTSLPTVPATAPPCASRTGCSKGR